MDKKILIFKDNKNLINLESNELNHKTIDEELYNKHSFTVTLMNELPSEVKLYFNKMLKEKKAKHFAQVEPVEININPMVNVKSKPYPIRSEHFTKFKEKIKELLKDGIINHSKSQVTSPAFVANKTNGDVRIIIDYRKVNDFINDDSYHFPSIYDHINRLKGMNYFSTIDLTNSFYQIKLNYNCKFITSFITPIGQFEFNTLPFGLKSSPKIFQRVLSEILFKFDNIIIFMDDVLIFDKTKDEHTNSIINVLQALQNANLNINLNKCEFFQTSIKYLGLEIDNEGYKADLSRLKDQIFAIKITNKKNIQKFTGYINFFRPFLPHISTYIAPLTEIMKTNDFKNTNLIQNIKEKARYLIRRNIKIMFPISTENFVLNTDSSEYACGGILTQKHGIVGIFSHKFTETQKQYNIMEKEFLSILLCLRKFRYILGSNEVSILTDNKNITTNTPINSSRVQRWKLLLAEFNYKLNFITGQNNCLPDLISRSCYAEIKRPLISSILLNLLIQQSVNKEEIIEYNLQRNNSFEDIIIYTDIKSRIFLTPHIANIFLSELHDNQGHPSQSAMYKTITPYYFSPNINKIIAEICSNCIICQQTKPLNKKYGKITGNISTTKYLEKISVDYFGPVYNCDKLFKTKHRKLWFILITENFSKYTKVFIVNNLKSENLIDKLKIYFKIVGKPEGILSDQGRTFTNKIYLKWAKENNINIIHSTIYNPTSNGLVERRNSILKTILTIYKSRSIREILQIIETRFNNFVCRSTKYLPVQLAKKTNPFDLLGLDDYKSIIAKAKEN